MCKVSCDGATADLKGASQGSWRKLLFLGWLALQGSIPMFLFNEIIKYFLATNGKLRTLPVETG